MKFRIQRVSDQGFRSTDKPPCEGCVFDFALGWWTKDVNTLEELLAISKSTNKPLIVSDDDEIEIYDDYRE